MYIQDPERAKIMEALIELGHGASDIMMHYWRNDPQITIKGDGSPLTIADSEISDLLVNTIPGAFPQYGLLTEEVFHAAEKRKELEHFNVERLVKQGVFIFDEIDGTREFSNGSLDFCFEGAFTQNGEAIMGIIAEPQYKRMIVASKGDGAYIITKEGRMEVPPLPDIVYEQAIVGDRKDYPGKKFKEVYKHFGITDDRVTHIGSFATRMLAVGLGTTHLSLGYTQSLSEWDYAGGVPILKEWGIHISDLEGNELVFNQEVPKSHNGVLIAHPALKTEALKRMETALETIDIGYH